MHINFFKDQFVCALALNKFTKRALMDKHLDIIMTGLRFAYELVIFFNYSEIGSLLI